MQSLYDTVTVSYPYIVRYILPALAVVILIRCVLSLFSFDKKDEVWGRLILPNGAEVELTHWENTVGRAHISDAVLSYPTISRHHAALIRGANGEWTLYDLGSSSGTRVRGKKVREPVRVKDGDVLEFGGVETVFRRPDAEEEAILSEEREQTARNTDSLITILLMTAYMVFLALELCVNLAEAYTPNVLFAYGALLVLMWSSYFVTRILARSGFEVETLAFFLSSVGFSVILSSAPGDVYKMAICLVAGVFLYWFLGWAMRGLRRAKALRWTAAAGGLALLAVNLVLARTTFGARNWLSFGGVTFQPSELVKICFVLAGAATLDRLFSRRNIVLFVLYSAVCVGCLALMGDFGTAVVFFVTYLVIAFMRSGSFGTILLSAGGAGLAAFIVISAKPYIARRFGAWRHAWEFPNDGGYQQVRTMAAAASGGFFGLGAGKGWLKKVFAADTDLVFGFVTEELGLITALLCVTAIVVMGLFTVRSVRRARSTFFVLAACAASSIFMVQLMLNFFGSVDILPLTGVTFPFVSKGGTSVIASWGLLAFIKACDTRESASFAVKREW